MPEVIRQQVLEALPSYNEAEVRFHVLDVILRALGYPETPGTYLKLEEKLDYPYYYIGRKNKKKDLPVGFPDYRAGVLGGRGSFIVEAKAANVALSPADVEQAHSYAAHVEVGADFFVLCNGLEVRVYETLAGLHIDPIVAIPLSEINARFHELENVLAPPNLTRLCRKTYDLELKLADGLPSAITIRDGAYDMRHWEMRLFLNGIDVTEQFKPHFRDVEEQMAMLQRDFELRVGEGKVRRDEEGRIVADVSFIGATRNNDEAMKLIGLDRFRFSTSEQFISTNPDEPTIFESTSDFQVAKGTTLPPMFGQAVPIELDVDMNIYVKSRMYLSGGVVSGDYLALADYHFVYPGLGQLDLELDLAGGALLRILG